MFKVEIPNLNKITTRFETMPDRVHNAVLKRFFDLAEKLKTHIAGDLLNGRILNRVTGRLAGSIQRKIEDSPNRIVATVYSNNTASPYNLVHEKGAIIPDRVPKNARALHWMAGGEHVFAKRARGFVLPQRSYMRTGLADMRMDIINGIRDAVSEEVRNA